MRAFVLSGGGALGPAQVGALRALLEHRILPEMVVGCSAGALNAAYLVRDLSLQNIERMADVWLSVTQHHIYPGNRMRAAWRLVRGKDSLYDNRNFYAFLQRHGVTPALTFGGVKAVRFYITATHLRSGKLHVFGDDPNDRVLDALMASTALTPLHPPWEINGERYIDGGTVTPLPLRVAIERGADEIYALHVIDGTPDSSEHSLIRGVTGLLTRSVSTMLRLQSQHDLLLAEVARHVKLHHVKLYVAKAPVGTDFSMAQELIDLGYAQAKSYLAESHSGPRPVQRKARSLRQRVLAVLHPQTSRGAELGDAPIKGDR